jgi:hypothetical protein
VDSGRLTEPLWDASAVPLPYPNNMMYVRDCTIKLLGSSFPNMTPAEVHSAVYFSFYIVVLYACLDKIVDASFVCVSISLSGDSFCGWTF